LSILDTIRRMFAARPRPTDGPQYVRGQPTPTGKLRARVGSIDFAAKQRRTDPRVLQLVDLTPSAKRVYAYLSRIADDDGYCFPFHRTIAKRTHLAESTVVRALHELEDHGLVMHHQRVSRRGQSSNLYQIHELQDD
jgi:hypothetical protein